MTDTEVMRHPIAFTLEHALEIGASKGAYIGRDRVVIARAVTAIVPEQNPLAHAELRVPQPAVTAHGAELTGHTL